jgi:hypothetical protein
MIIDPFPALLQPRGISRCRPIASPWGPRPSPVAAVPRVLRQTLSPWKRPLDLGCWVDLDEDTGRVVRPRCAAHITEPDKTINYPAAVALRPPRLLYAQGRYPSTISRLPILQPFNPLPDCLDYYCYDGRCCSCCCCQGGRRCC